MRRSDMDDIEILLDDDPAEAVSVCRKLCDQTPDDADVWGWLAEAQVAAGDYTVVDLSGRYFLDSRRRHRINVRLENVFDEVYTTRNARNFLDRPATPFLVTFLGVPRTLHVNYSVGF